MMLAPLLTQKMEPATHQLSALQEVKETKLKSSYIQIRQFQKWVISFFYYLLYWSFGFVIFFVSRFPFISGGTSSDSCASGYGVCCLCKFGATILFYIISLLINSKALWNKSKLSVKDNTMYFLSRKYFCLTSLKGQGLLRCDPMYLSFESLCSVV